MIAALYHLLRLARAGFVFAREGVFALVDTRPLPLPAKAAVALARLIERPSAKSGENRLAAALTRLGPTYVKLGQFLATRPDVVGTAIARDLESLQDKMAPFPQGEAEAASIQTLITGEGPHHTAVEAPERGVVVIYAGHYATETLGIAAVTERLANEIGLPWSFVSAPTGL